MTNQKTPDEINKITEYAVLVAKENLFDARQDNEIDEFSIILTSLFNKGFNLGRDIGEKIGEENIKNKLNQEIIRLIELHHKEWHGLNCEREDYECDYKSIIKELQKGDTKP